MRAPGLRPPAEFCDVDHAHEWADGGSTDQENSRVRCGRHNVAKSKRRWRSKRATNGHTYTVRADGTIMLPVGIRPPTLYPDEEDPAEVARLNRLIRARVAALRAA